MMSDSSSFIATFSFSAELWMSSSAMISRYLKALQAVLNGLGVFFSPMPMTCLPDSLSLMASLVKSLSLETMQNPSTLSE